MINSVLYNEQGFFLYMPKNQISVEELRVRVMKLKHDLGWEPQDQKELTQRYLNHVLDILDEYRF